MTKLQRLESYLVAGNEATARQITSMFGIKNPTAAVHALRAKGVCVYGNEATLYTGEKTTKYKVGKPTKNMIKIAHAMGLFA